MKRRQNVSQNKMTTVEMYPLSKEQQISDMENVGNKSLMQTF